MLGCRPFDGPDRERTETLIAEPRPKERDGLISERGDLISKADPRRAIGSLGRGKQLVEPPGHRALSTRRASAATKLA